MSSRKASKVKFNFTYVVIVFILIFFMGLLYRLTNGFKSTFCVKINGHIVSDSYNNFIVSDNKPLKGTVSTLSLNPDGTTYSIKVVPNQIDGKNFVFYVNGERHIYQAEKDLTEAFEISVNGNEFSVSPKCVTVTDTLRAIYGDTVTPCDNRFYENMFTLVVFSIDEKSEIRLNFSVYGKVTAINFENDIIEF